MADFETCDRCGRTFMFFSHEFLTPSADLCRECRKTPQETPMARPKIADSDKLVRIPLGLTPRQVARLERIIAADGSPLQEILRRAVNDLCDKMEVAFQLLPLPMGAQPSSNQGTPISDIGLPTVPTTGQPPAVPIPAPTTRLGITGFAPTVTVTPPAPPPPDAVLDALLNAPATATRTMALLDLPEADGD